MAYDGPTRHEILSTILQYNRCHGTNGMIHVEKVPDMDLAIADSIRHHQKERRSRHNAIQKAAIELIKDLEEVEKMDTRADAEALDWKGIIESCKKMEGLLENGRKYVEKNKNDGLRKKKENEREVKHVMDGEKKREAIAYKTGQKMLKQAEQAKKCEDKRKDRGVKEVRFKIDAPDRIGARTPDQGRKKERQEEGARLKVPQVQRDDSWSPDRGRKKEQAEHGARLEVPQARRAGSRSPDLNKIDRPKSLNPSKTLKKRSSNDNLRAQTGHLAMTDKENKARDAYMEGLKLASEVKKF
ncbi:hypothetical protein EG329_011761 [Mollisiaceae sp. DMI_Dod_QoI]|nr:hypothetical protein EG329_011761 [Helotiales sp. DMI_Dod_QoI]